MNRADVYISRPPPADFFTSPQAMLDHLGQMTWCMLLDAVKMFYAAHDREPTKIYVTPAMELALRGRWHDCHRDVPAEQMDLRRDWPRLMGKETVWDSDEFKLE